MNDDQIKTASDFLTQINAFSQPGASISGEEQRQIFNNANLFIKENYGYRVEHGTDYHDGVEALLNDIANTKVGNVKAATGQIGNIIRLAKQHRLASANQIEDFKNSLNEKVRTEVFFTKESLQYEARKAGLTHYEIAVLINQAFPEKPFIPDFEHQSTREVFESDLLPLPQTTPSSSIPTQSIPTPSSSNTPGVLGSILPTIVSGLSSPFIKIIASKLVNNVGIQIAQHRKFATGILFSLLFIPVGYAFGVQTAYAAIAGFGTGWMVGRGVSGTTSSASSFANGLVGGISALASASVTVFTAPMIVAVIGIPVAIAFILFIINSGAYIVPPSSLVTEPTSQSPYISVTKTADITTLTNKDLPKTITYTIKVSAPLGTITNLEFQHDCSVLSKSGTKDCTHPTPNETPAAIEPNSPFEFSYTVSYDQAYQDSVVTDTFMVRAKAADATKDESSSGSVSVVIGNPPTSCFDIQGDGWKPGHKQNLLSAAAIISSYTSYSTKLCSEAGTIKVILNHYANPEGWGEQTTRGIELNDGFVNGVDDNTGGLASVANATYLLAHESGHVYANNTESGSAESKRYKLDDAVTAELPLCSYSATIALGEGFPEMIALYITREQSTQWTNPDNECTGTFQESYPNHYRFAKDVIFN